jgi:hypothetical protein
MKLHVFCFDLPQSDACFIKAYPAETTEAFLDGHVSAFAFFGGVPLSIVPVLARKPGALRNGAPFKDWVLPAAMERVRRKLAGVEDGNRQMVDILTAVLIDRLPAVEAACAEALEQGVHSADVILNILARRRDPGPPLTILTPDALKLRHLPLADCVRYDRLRSSV